LTSGWKRLEHFLSTDPRDTGCEEAMNALHVYAELVTSGQDPEERWPGIAAHFEACGPCREDLVGLLDAIRAAAYLPSEGREPRAIPDPHPGV
jgi:hypothetical protein